MGMQETNVESMIAAELILNTLWEELAASSPPIEIQVGPTGYMDQEQQFKGVVACQDKAGRRGILCRVLQTTAGHEGYDEKGQLCVFQRYTNKRHIWTQGTPEAISLICGAANLDDALAFKKLIKTGIVERAVGSYNRLFQLI